jgi:hypothetical protein
MTIRRRTTERSRQPRPRAATPALKPHSPDTHESLGIPVNLLLKKFHAIKTTFEK